MSKNRRKKCSKIRYDTLEEAQDHIEALRVAQPFDKYHAYPCKCGKYHVAHKYKRRRL